jgi:hypothetical protein
LPRSTSESSPYVVTASLAPIQGTPNLDPLQAEGVGAILERGLSQAREAVGPDGSHITVMDWRVGTHPNGAMVAVAVTSPSADLAKSAVHALVHHVVAASPLLPGWEVTDVEVRAGDVPAVVGPGTGGSR